MKPKLEVTTASELKLDERNANRGTPFGTALLEQSLREHGAGRSILLDKHNRVIAGNKTVEQAVAVGIERIVVVPTDGRTLVAVKRTDLELNSTGAARRLAIADNRVGEVNLAWDPVEISNLLREDAEALTGLFTDDELSRLQHTADPSPASDTTATDTLVENICECPKCGYQWTP